MAPRRTRTRGDDSESSTREQPRMASIADVEEIVQRMGADITAALVRQMGDLRHPVPPPPVQPVPPPPPFVPPPPEAQHVDKVGIRLERFRKMGAPNFLGTESPIQADMWLQRLEKIFAALLCTDEEKASFAVFLLDGEADHWWRVASTKALKDGQVLTWQMFLSAFKTQYFSRTFTAQKEAEFLALVQGSMTVREYERKFTQLSRFAPHVVSCEESKCRKFERV